MGKLCRRVGIFAVFAVVAAATTLEQLSLDELISQSTDVVRGAIVSSRVERSGSLIYTVYRVRVSERWKGEPTSEVEVSLPGGAAEGVSQSFGGVPQLEIGREHVFLLWRGRSGRTQIMGLTQGLFDLNDEKGDARLVQNASPDVVIIPGSDSAQQINVSLNQFVQSVRALKGGVIPRQ